MQNLEQQFSKDPLITQSSKSVREYSDTIPVDLLIDIFSRVPAKSIARFSCISKLWNSIFRRPDFTELFLSQSLTRPRLFFSFRVNQELFLFSSHQPQTSEHESSCLVATRYKYKSKYLPVKTYPPINGLVFIHTWGTLNEYYNHVICNPVTGESITLSNVKDFGVKERYFGYDPIRKQFKVMFKTSSNSHEVLTLETGECLWRTIEAQNYYPNLPGYNEIFINGVLYYGTYNNHQSMIVSFDFVSEKFGFINIDQDMSHGRIWNFFNYKGKLGAHEYINSSENKFVFWVLEDVEKHKWSKTIGLFPHFCDNEVYTFRIVGMTNTGEIVFAPYKISTSHFCVFFYNLETKIFRKFIIKGFEEFKHRDIFISTFIDYVETLKFM